MPRSKCLTSFFCWLFVAAVFSTSVQVSLAGFYSDDSSWFSYMVNAMAEEETEDCETEETESAKDAKWMSPLLFFFELNEINRAGAYRSVNPYISFVGEVGSPPPEA